MKGIKGILIAVICSMVFVGCGKVSTLQFYKACYTGDEKKVDEYLQYENFTIELNENDPRELNAIPLILILSKSNWRFLY